MKLLPPIIALLLVVLIANSAFIVPAGQSALVLQFGRIEGAGSAADDYKPGLHLKLPLIQQVVRYDRRILNLEAQPERYFTSEKKAVNVDFYVKWRIADPAAYYRSFGADETQTLARERLVFVRAEGTVIRRRVFDLPLHVEVDIDRFLLRRQVFFRRPVQIEDAAIVAHHLLHRG